MSSAESSTAPTPAAAPLPAAAPVTTTAAPAASKPVPPAKTSWGKRITLVVILLLVVFKGIPWVLHSLRTESTDDAYVNSYVTFVAPRVGGQVARVLVDDNNRVKKGDVMVQLDEEPLRVQLSIKEAALVGAQADLVAADAAARSQVARSRGARFKLTHAIEDVDNQVALLRSRFATWEQAKASEALADSEFGRAKKLLETKVTSPEEFERKREALDVSHAQVKQALESVYQSRAALGLPREPEKGKALTDTPPDLDQNFSSVREALAELINAASVLGVVQSSYNLTPKETIAEFYRRDPGGDIDKIYEKIIKDAPGVLQARAAVTRAERDVDQAKLDLRYCKVVAEIDGVITRRNVNPGNNVQVGQNLMAIRSLTDVWVDANFKETQLRKLRIGQRVELKVDMYGSKETFEGRVSGFTMGTGSTLALLPAQNATGNFVKVVQRLPVRIDLLNYDSSKVPLFVGLSVEPVVDLRRQPDGPNAGQFLQAVMATPAPKP